MTIVFFWGGGLTFQIILPQLKSLYWIRPFPISMRFFRSEPREIIENVYYLIYKTNQYSNSVKNRNNHHNIVEEWWEILFNISNRELSKFIPPSYGQKEHLRSWISCPGHVRKGSRIYCEIVLFTVGNS